MTNILSAIILFGFLFASWRLYWKGRVLEALFLVVFGYVFSDAFWQMWWSLVEWS
jgi:hypothetical protein